jgi:penicillin-insensitive murein endopeptidase
LIQKRILFSLLACSLLCTAAGPAPGPLRIIGTPTNGCIAGAVELPDRGPNFSRIRMSRSEFWGAPLTIERIEMLALRAQQAGLPPLYINDISHPRGGRFPGHAGHEQGLEADIWLDVNPKPALTDAERDALEIPSLVMPDGFSVNKSLWRPEHVKLIQLAATLPDIERIFVNPAIKQALCDTVTGDRRWLHVVRPWYGHASHMHLRFACPADQPECVTMPAIPAGDGCDATLQWWFDQLAHPAPPATTHATPPPIPAACRQILNPG